VTSTSSPAQFAVVTDDGFQIDRTHAVAEQVFDRHARGSDASDRLRLGPERG